MSLKSLHFILFCQGHVLQAKKNSRIMNFCFLSLMKNYFQQAFMHREKKYTHIIFSSNFLSKSKFAISFSPIFPHLTKKGKKKKKHFHEIAKCNLSINGMKLKHQHIPMCLCHLNMLFLSLGDARYMPK